MAKSNKEITDVENNDILQAESLDDSDLEEIVGGAGKGSLRSRKQQQKKKTAQPAVLRVADGNSKDTYWVKC